MLVFWKKYHKIVSLILLSIVIFTYMFRDLKCQGYGQEYIISVINIRNIVGVIMVLIFIFTAITKRYDMKTFFVAIFVLAFCFVLSIQTETRDFWYGMDLFFYALIVILCEDIDYDIIIKVVFLSFIISWIVIFIRTLIHETSLWVNVDTTTMRVRHAIGYGNINSGLFGFVFNYILLYYIYIRKNKMLLREYILLFILNCVFFYTVNLRGTFLCISVALLFSILIKCNRKFSVYLNIYGALMYMSVLIAVIVALILPFLYDESNIIFEYLNRLLTGRLQLGHDAITNYNITLFGQLTNFEILNVSNWVYNTVDSSYLRFLITYGIVPFLMLIMIMLYFAYLINKKKDIYMFFIFLILQVRFITELDLFPVLRYNYFFFIWAYYNCTNSKITNYKMKEL